MTAPAPLVVAGVDLAAGRGITEIAILRADGDEPPHWEAARHRAVASDAQIVDALAAAQPRVIAIDAPLSLPAAVSAALRSTSLPDPSLESSASSYTRAAERDPIWSELGARPLPVSFLGGLTFRALALLPRLRAALPGARIIETWPTGVYRALGIAPRLSSPASARTRAAKSSTAWRAAVQTALTAQITGLPLPAPGDPTLPLGVDLLDALAAALAALAFARGAYRATGDADEGQIILPLPPTHP